MAAALLRRLRPTSPPAKARRQLAVDLVRDVRALDQRIARVQERLQAAVKESKTTLVELVGIGPVLAAKFLGEVGDIGRFATKARFAAHNGTAPIEASSGQVVRHSPLAGWQPPAQPRLYLMAIVQLRHPTLARPTTSARSPKASHPKKRCRV
jgi:transposase